VSRVERRCSDCGAWNTNGEARCASCGALISPEKIRLEDEEKRAALELSRPPSFLDKFFSKWRNSRNPVVKAAFYFAYGIWLMYAAILAFFLWLVAAMPG